MQRVKKKRGRANVKNSAVKTNVSLAPEPTTKKGKALAMTKPDVVSGNSDDFCKMPDTDRHRPLGIFEFPWQKEMGSLAPELKGCTFTDVFFSSLVDGCYATIGFPGDRLSLPMASPVNLPQASDEDPEDTDCIWSSILQQPLSFVYSTKDSDS
ncbi:hypothetical protein IEQ34_011496 [Dendrobium chrysotoxum]|uniref:Uncharacterized protein n=1 Tax=Dendrobium chrysotoxum TaxID=161865 RepID=A0AAV7GQQ1_DENCH|nr:hypothetical protein IEQ34_011496 [Dendrobium chrysotoxum]